MRWWLTGFLVFVGVGVFLALRKFAEGRSIPYRFVGNEAENKNFGAFPPEIPDYEFDEADFIA